MTLQEYYSFLEVQEEIKDLLASGSGPHPEVVIREDGGNIFLQGATVQEVSNVLGGVPV